MRAGGSAIVRLRRAPTSLLLACPANSALCAQAAIAAAPAAGATFGVNSAADASDADGSAIQNRSPGLMRVENSRLAPGREMRRLCR